MTRKSILAAVAATAALISGTASFAPAAEAHGIRLGFGVPLGAFIARPYAPDSHRSYSSRRHQQHKSYGAARAEREARAAESARVRAARRAERARQAAAAKAAAADRAAEKDNARRELAKLNNAQTTKIETASTTPEAAPAKPAETTVSAVDPATTDTTEAVTEPAKAEEPATQTAQRDPEPDSKDEDKPATRKDCKKFIPAVGVTISVGC